MDFALGPFSITQQRAEIVDFTFPITSDLWTILLPIGGSAADPWGIVRPFSWEVWSALVPTVISVVAVLLLINMVKVNDSERVNAATIWGFVMRTLMLVSPVWAPRGKASDRGFGYLWSLMAFVLCISYSGVLTSLLTVPVFHLPINRFDWISVPSASGITKNI